MSSLPRTPSRGKLVDQPADQRQPCSTEGGVLGPDRLGAPSQTGPAALADPARPHQGHRPLPRRDQPPHPRVPQVTALVYIAGFAPDKSESLVQRVTKNPGSEIGPKTLIARKYPLPGGGEGTDLYLTKSGVETAFAGDVPRRHADQMWAEQRPFSQEAFDSVSDEPAWKTIPSWYLVATQDHAIPPATQRSLANRAHANVSQVKSSHAPMISQPAATTKVILAAAKAIG